MITNAPKKVKIEAEFTIYRGKSGADEAAVVFRQESAEEDDATFFYFLDTIKSVKI